MVTQAWNDDTNIEVEESTIDRTGHYPKGFKGHRIELG